MSSFVTLSYLVTPTIGLRHLISNTFKQYLSVSLRPQFSATVTVGTITYWHNVFFNPPTNCPFLQNAAHLSQYFTPLQNSLLSSASTPPTAITSDPRYLKISTFFNIWQSTMTFISPTIGTISDRSHNLAFRYIHLEFPFLINPTIKRDTLKKTNGVCRGFKKLIFNSSWHTVLFTSGIHIYKNRILTIRNLLLVFHNIWLEPLFIHKAFMRHKICGKHAISSWYWCIIWTQFFENVLCMHQFFIKIYIKRTIFIMWHINFWKNTAIMESDRCKIKEWLKLGVLIMKNSVQFYKSWIYSIQIIQICMKMAKTAK